MRSGPVLLVVSWFLLASCAQRAAVRVAGDGEFVIELGGSGRSLASSLRNCKVELLPDPEPLRAPVVDAQDGHGADVRAGDAMASPGGAGVEPEPRGERDEPPPIVEATFFEVELGPQETLMDVAQKHLGSARRFKEIMALNGFSERDTRRLRAGTRIKVPKVVDPGTRK